MTTASEILLTMTAAHQRMQPAREAFEREVNRLCRSLARQLLWRMHLKPANPQLLLTYDLH